MLELISFNSSLEDALHSDKFLRYVIGKNGMFELTSSSIYDVLVKRHKLKGCPELPFDEQTISFLGKDYVVSAEGFWEASGISGVFKQVTNIPDTIDIEPYFNYKLPPIPKNLLYEIVIFFKAIAKQFQTEVLAEICYDKDAQTYFINIPQQQISASRVFYAHETLPQNVVKVAEIHSHHTMKASFSKIDDNDEQLSGLIYGVVGGFKVSDPAEYSISLRVRDGENFAYISAKDIFTPKAEAINKIDLDAKIHLWMKKIFIQSKKGIK